MTYQWCTECGSRTCFNESSHRASRSIQYRADFMLGGRIGKRIRKLFPIKKDAEAYEYITKADFKRGLYIVKDSSKMSLDELYNQYNEQYIQRHMKGWKKEQYRFKAFLEMFKDRALQSIGISDWNRYLTERLKIIGKTSANRELASFKSMFKWAVKNKLLNVHPFKDVEWFKEEVIKVRWLNETEIENILTACTKLGDLSLRNILVIALNTGFRKANLISVTSNDILGNRIRAVRTKSGKSYEVPICQELATVLNQNALPLDFTNFYNRFSKAVTDKTVTLHTFRHTFAAQALRKGIPIDRVCAWMGHHSVEFTRIHYGHLCPNQEAVEIELLNLGKSRVNLTPSVSPTMVRGLENGGGI